MTDNVKNAIKAIHDAGFKAYMRNPKDTWVYFTNGKHIGYAQESSWGFVTLCTVHVPNKKTGTGFRLDDVENLNKENLELAFKIAPKWASSKDRESVKKWKDFNEFVNSSPFNLGYQEVEPKNKESN